MKQLTRLTLLTLLVAPTAIRAVQVCGDSVKEGTEACDDGNKINYDGCSSTCTIETGFNCVVDGNNLSVCTEICGDGKNFKKLYPTNQCDDGDTTDGDGCSSGCLIETGWSCSGGSKTTADTCKEVCGDGYNFDATGTWSVGDACDDGNKINNDGCSYKCVVEDGWYCEPGSASDTSTATNCYEICNDGLDFGTYECDTDGNTSGCQDGVIQPGWDCSGGTYTSPDTCTEICGDGYHFAEACDDGNFYDYDGCSAECTIEDGFYFADLVGTYASNVAELFEEECDGYDYGYLDCDCGLGAGCTGCTDCGVIAGYRCQTADVPSDGSSCTEICGDGYNYAQGTQCDDGNLRSGDGCSKTCQIETGYTCDFTTSGTADDCYEICGDGLDYQRYECDDGNSANYDGCNSDCELLDGWYCYGGTKTSPDYCYELCGDGRNYFSLNGLTSCDDGNTDSGDGCSSGCSIESGYECSGGGYDSADFCHETCGDGLRMSTYFDCDDGNSVDGDGCSSGCLVENGFICDGGTTTSADICYEECGDGIRFTASTTTTFCDDGNIDTGDGCDDSCAVEDGFYCYGGSTTGPDTCYEDCGDGKNFGYLNCDDGNNDGGDGCSSGCDIETGYDCSGGSSSGADSCYEICQDGLNMGQYECDDGNAADGDGCSSGCAIEDGYYCYGGDHSTADDCYEICGDPYHFFYDQATMQCDDNNSDSGDGCSSGCMIESGWECTTDWNAPTTPTVCTEICGDGVRFNTDSTYCDTGHAYDVDGCSSGCDVQDGWYCYGGTDSAADGCYEECGDSYKFGTFDCEDGNTSGGDGCDSDCQIEDGWYCYTDPNRRRLYTVSVDQGLDVCNEICGDTNYDHDFGEYACQDSNTANGDGCTSGCTIEDGFYCIGGSTTTSDTCYEICGDDYDLRILDCEDGNSVDYDGCTDCTIDDGYYCVDSTTVIVGYSGALVAYDVQNCYDECGDGLLMDQSLYACDDGNSASGDGCSAKCQIERGYKCEGGSHTTADTCSEICGDGYNMPLVTGDCDDGNVANNDGCSSLCVVEDGWYCYGGNSTAQDYCYEICGDSYDFGEYACDDGNSVDDDGCSSGCVIESGWTCSGGSSTANDVCYDDCGDGLLMSDSYTECDDGNTDATDDGCTSTCMVLDGWYCYGGDSTQASTCNELSGDGKDFGTYACDNYDNGTFDGCLNGIVQDGYYCYGGTTSNGGDTCYEICGDHINPSQMDGNANDCDDNNNIGGDGCSATCTVEDGYYCYGGDSTQADTCYEDCGDGLMKGTFDCDDGNNVDNDGCSSGCTIESGYECDDSEPSDCYEICGDGINLGFFECDDGDNNSGDGCDADCAEELGYDCTGGSASTADTCSQLDYITGSLDDCQEYASYFFSTCSENAGTTAPTFGAMASESETCESGYGSCIGTTDADDVCSWTRKLCVTCYKDSGYVMIRVQTNSVPDHCYYASSVPDENEIDFSVAFSAQDFASTLPAETVTTQAQLDALLCASGWPASATTTTNLATYGYTENSGTDVDKIVGVALNGVPIFSGVSELGMDAYAAQSYNGVKASNIAPDYCMGDNSHTTFYHYYTMSPCILTGAYKSSPTGKTCASDTTCKSDKETYILKAKSSQKALTPIGIARDGHKIYGPYDDNGDTWDPCDVDMCNGLMIDGEYAYVMTTFFPYTVGCFAVGNQPLLYASCSTNPRKCATSGVFLNLGYTLLAMLALFYMIIQ